MPLRSPDGNQNSRSVSVTFFSGETVELSGLDEQVTVATLCARLEKLHPLDPNTSCGYQLIHGTERLQYLNMLPSTVDMVSAMVLPSLVQGAYVHWAGEEMRKDGATLTQGMRGFIVRGGGNEWTVKFPGMGMLRGAQRKFLRPLCCSEVLELFPAAEEAEVPEKPAEASFHRDRLRELIVAAEAIGVDEEDIERVRSRLDELGPLCSFPKRSYDNLF